MWGNNALRLRRNISAVRLERCTSKLYHKPAASAPISGLEFLEALEVPLPKSRWKADETVGLAVSGGVDSMALATLFSMAQRMEHALPKCHAIIIDHKARPESTEEAHWVSEQLRQKLGVQSSIIPLVWPEQFDHHDSKNFETVARSLRYSALGAACRKGDIQSLLVAHHEDDQAETVMIRLIDKKWRTGLQAMQPAEWIPECHGLYGVHHSGRPLKRDDAFPFPVEDGGLKILRPFLGFQKSRLIATCKEHGVSWSEDKTNADQSLTIRNTIRHTMQHYQLPIALSQASLVEVAQNMQARVRSHQENAERLFEDTLISLDIQTGSLIVRFPESPALLGGRPIRNETDKNRARNTAYLYLQRIASMISPKESSPAQFSNAADNIWPSLREDTASDFQTDFTAYGVYFQLRNEPSPFKTDETGLSDRHEMEWRLMRQPPSRQELEAGSALAITIPPHRSRPDLANTYHLFDNRYWIKIKNLTDDDLVIRLLTPAEAAKLSRKQAKLLYSQRKPSPYQDIMAALSLLKSDHFRHAIPGVFRRSGSDPSSDALILLPTFDAHILPSEHERFSDMCEYSVHYKRINVGDRALNDMIARGISAKDIKRENARLRNDGKMLKLKGFR